MEQTYFKKRDWNSLPKNVVNSLVDEVLKKAVKKLHMKSSDMKVLDVGSGTGEYSIAFAKKVQKVIGVEPYKVAFLEAKKRIGKNNSKLHFVNKKIEDFRTKEKFEIALSLTTIEHMQHAELSFRNIFKLLKPGGILYVTAPNKLWPYEHHYKLPFLSWLPLSLANYYVRITKRGRSYIDSAYSKTYFGMKMFFNKFHCTYTFALPSDLNSSYIGCGNNNSFYTIIKKMGILLIKKVSLFWVFSKGFIVIATKEPFLKNLLYYYQMVFERLMGNNVQKEERWLDLGCGEGQFIGNLGDKAKRFGYDVDPKKILKATKQYSDVNFKLGMVGGKLPYQNNYFDRVFLFHVLEHVDSESFLINEVQRILKKGGKLYLSSPYDGLFSWADAANLRFQLPFLHKILATAFYGKKVFNQLFGKNKEYKLMGDCSINRNWHKHYKETEIRSLMKGKFRIEEFSKFSLFQPFLLDLVNLWRFLFKKDNSFINKLVIADNKINAGDFSYNMLVVATKK